MDPKSSSQGTVRIQTEIIPAPHLYSCRWEECILIVRDDLDWPVSSMYVKEYFKANAKEEVR